MQRFGSWILLVVGVLVGMFAGWWFGSASACGSACNFDVALFEAIGTWLGGIGVALVVGILAWQRNQQEKASTQADARREATTLANGCALRYSPIASSDGGFDKVHIVFNNKLSERVSAVAIRTDDGVEIGRDAHVLPGRGWGKAVQLTELRLTGTYTNKEFAYAALNQPGVGKDCVEFEYTIRGFRFRRAADIVQLVGGERWADPNETS